MLDKRAKELRNLRLTISLSMYLPTSLMMLQNPRNANRYR
jgi:hypothetical protein